VAALAVLLARRLVSLAVDAEQVPSALLSVSGMLFDAAHHETARRFFNGEPAGMHVVQY
jgi:hypothetical protein